MGIRTPEQRAAYSGAYDTVDATAEPVCIVAKLGVRTPEQRVAYSGAYDTVYGQDEKSAPAGKDVTQEAGASTKSVVDDVIKVTVPIMGAVAVGIIALHLGGSPS